MTFLTYLSRKQSNSCMARAAILIDIKKADNLVAASRPRFVILAPP